MVGSLTRGRATSSATGKRAETTTNHDPSSAKHDAAGPHGTRYGGRRVSVVTTALARVEGRTVLVLPPRRLPVAGAEDGGGAGPGRAGRGEARGAGHLGRAEPGGGEGGDPVVQRLRKIAKEALRSDADLERLMSDRPGPPRAASCASTSVLVHVCGLVRGLFRVPAPAGRWTARPSPPRRAGPEE